MKACWQTNPERRPNDDNIIFILILIKYLIVDNKLEECFQDYRTKLSEIMMMTRSFDPKEPKEVSHNQAFYDVFDKLSQEYFGFGELLTHKDVHNLDFKKKEEIMGLLQEEYELKSSIDPGIC